MGVNEFLTIVQVTQELLRKHMKVEAMVTPGGTSLKDDIMRLHNPVHILVATPGRCVASAPFPNIAFHPQEFPVVSSKFVFP